MDEFKKHFSYKLVLIIDAILLSLYLVFTILFITQIIDEKLYGILSILSLGTATILLIMRVLLSIMIFTNNVHKMNSPEYQEKLMKAMDKVNNGGYVNDLDCIVNDYLLMISKRRYGKIESFKISSNDYLEVQVNGEDISLYTTTDDTKDYKEAYYE